MLGTCAMVGSVDECLCVSDDSMEPLQVFAVGAEIFSLMRVVVCQRFAITPESICFYNRTSFQILIHKLLHGRNLNIGCDQHLQILWPSCFVLSHRNKYTLISCSASPFSLDFRAKVGIVKFNDSAQGILGIPCFHSFTNPAQEIPGGFVAHGNLASQRQSRDSSLVAGYKVDRPEPLGQRKMGAVHDGIGGERGLMSAFGALIPPGAIQRIAMPVTADRADKAIGPSDMIQILCTGFFIRKPLEKLRKTHSLLEGFACCFLLIHNGTTFTVPLLYNCRCPIKRTFTTSRPVLFKADSLNPCLLSTTPYFTSFLKDWLKLMKTQVKLTTYSGYEKIIMRKVIPYFDERYPRIRLDAVSAKHIQDYYSYELEENHVCANTVKHRHANIHKALSYAYKTDLIQSNPADKVELPKIEKYTGQFYNQKQIEELFRVVKGDPIEFGVITAAFYGLRRSEILGLRWDAIDFEEKTITIRHTLHEVRVNGKMKIVASDTTKTKSSFRTLPLVPPFEEILLKMKREQEENRRLCGNCYCQEYLGYIYVNEIGDIMKPSFLTAHFSAVLKENNLPHIRFHDLRHSCASLLFAQGVSLKEIQAWLGHSTIGTTANIYTHLDENNKLSSANAILSILTDK